MNFDPAFLRNFLLVVTGFTGAFLAALWVALVIWTYRDIRNRARDPLVQILATTLVALLTLPGVLVYLILRPSRSLDEEYQRTLEEEALLQAIEDQSICPGCERRVREEWQVCPNCQTKLKKGCHSCGRLMELPWNICPFCGTPVPGVRREGLTMDEALRELKIEPEFKEIPGLGLEDPGMFEAREAEAVGEESGEDMLDTELPIDEPTNEKEPDEWVGEEGNQPEKQPEEDAR